MDYFQYQEAILNLDETPQTKMVAIVIASHYNWKKKEFAFPSNSTIAKKASLSIKTVIKAKNRLVELGYLTSQQRFNTTNVYSPTLPTVTEGNRGVYQGKPNNEYNKEINKEDKDSAKASSLVNNSLYFYQEELHILDTNDTPVLAEVKASPSAAADLLDWFG